MSKELWRAGFMTCPEHCQLSATPASECECKCKPEVTADDTHPYQVRTPEEDIPTSTCARQG